MKKLITFLFVVNTVLLGVPFSGEAQLLDKLGQKAKQKLEKKAEKQVDKTLNGPGVKQGTTVNGSENTTSTAGAQNSDSGESPNTNKKEDYVSSYKSKFDFVPGEKVIVSDDFSEDAVGDFPADWFTDGSGEIVTIEGAEGKWLMMKGSSKYFIDKLLGLPDNFTIQFDLRCSVPFSWSSGVVNLVFEDVVDLDRYRKGNNGGEMDSNNVNYSFNMDLHPGRYNPGNSPTLGYGHYRMANQRGSIALKEIFMPGAEKSNLKISIWRQNQMLRVYLNENKILDLPKILPSEMKPNIFAFRTEGFEDGDNYFVSNLRIAVGDPDTRSKLLTDGKLVTTGILFGVNSDQIKTESYGVLKEIAGILKENENINVKIVGHTDNDGDEAKNLELSKRRAESVKAALTKDFGIGADRMITDGKGETDPVAPNTSAINKANNRRVEFFKVN
jgi:OmpA-OmpF porin, OOP family